MKRISWSTMTDLMSGSSAPLNSLLNLMADISISTKMSSMPHLCVLVAVIHNSVRQTFFLGVCTGLVFLSLFLSLLFFACSSFLSELWLPVWLLHTEAGISYRIICLCLLLWWIQTDVQEKRHMIDVCVLQGCMKVKMKTCMIHLMQNASHSFCWFYWYWQLQPWLWLALHFLHTCTGGANNMKPIKHASWSFLKMTRACKLIWVWRRISKVLYNGKLLFGELYVVQSSECSWGTDNSFNQWIRSKHFLEVCCQCTVEKTSELPPKLVRCTQSSYLCTENWSAAGDITRLEGEINPPWFWSRALGKHFPSLGIPCTSIQQNNGWTSDWWLCKFSVKACNTP